MGNGAGDAPGAIPGLRITAPDGGLGVGIGRLIATVNKVGVEPSGARRSLVARRKRSPSDVVRILIGAYGYTLDPVVYTQGVSIGGRLVAWETGITQDDPTGDIRQIAESLLADPGPFLDTGPDGAALAGLTWACDMARITGDERAATTVHLVGRPIRRQERPATASSRRRRFSCRRHVFCRHSTRAGVSTDREQPLQRPAGKVHAELPGIGRTESGRVVRSQSGSEVPMGTGETDSQRSDTPKR